MSQTTTESAETVLREVEAMVPNVRARGAEGEEIRELPQATIAELEAAGVWGALRPASAGGLGLGLDSYFDIIRTLSRGDASTGWIAGFFMGHNFLMSKLPAEAQKDIFDGRPWALMSGTITQPIQAETVEGGYRISCRSRFASGVMHADWHMIAALSETGPLACFVPVSDLTIHDTWNVPGMKATGSQDVEATNLFVPVHRTIGVEDLMAVDNPGSRLHQDYATLRYPLNRVLMLIHPGVAIGVADAALELFSEAVGERFRLQSMTQVKEEAATHELYGLALHKRKCAELLTRDAIAMMDAGYSGDAPGLTLEQRAEVNLALAGAVDQACSAVDLLIRGAGASIHRTGHPLDRICRDTQVMRNHTIIDWRFISTLAGRIALGQGLGTVQEEAV